MSASASMATGPDIASRLKLTSDVLGTGGFARVLKADLDGQPVAVKLLLPKWCDPADGRCLAYQQQLIKEGRFLAKTNHRSIVKCLGLVQLPPQHPGLGKEYKHPAWGIVLELCKGDSVSKMVMKQMVEYGKVYTDFEALGWMIDVAEALLYLHTLPEPVVHRDLKPENILLVTVNKPGGGSPQTIAKLADFGLHMSLNMETKGRVLRQRCGSFTSGVGAAGRTSGSLAARISRQPSFQRVSVGLIVPTVEGNVMGDSILEEQGRESNGSAASDSSLAELYSRLVPCPDTVSAPRNVNQSSRTSSLIQTDVEGRQRMNSLSQTPCTQQPLGKPPLHSRPASRTQSPVPAFPSEDHIQSHLADVTGAGCELSSTKSSAAAGWVHTSLVAPVARRMRASDGTAFPLTSSSPKQLDNYPGRNTGLVSKDIGSISPTKTMARRMRASEGNISIGPVALDLPARRRGTESLEVDVSRRQSNYNMIFSCEPRETVTDIIQKALASQYEVAFKMTGDTGSAIYMSPEVRQNIAYNEKIDVFAFGVVLFEVFSRHLMITSLRADADAYAAKVAEGYRPERTDKMDTELFDLIDWCWRHDPNERPQITDIIECLRVLRIKMSGHATAGVDSKRKGGQVLDGHVSSINAPDPSCGCCIT